MSFESRLQWDTNINSVGGAKDTLFVTSPYSHNSSANAAQGSLTYGNLMNEFAPPKIMVTPIDDGYYIKNRFNGAINGQAGDVKYDENVVEVGADEVPNDPTKVTNKDKEGYGVYVAPSRRSEKFVTNSSRKKVKIVEPYTEMPGFKGSEIHQEKFTAEETNGIIVILMSVIVFCIVGLCFGYLVPKVNVRVWPDNKLY